MNDNKYYVDDNGGHHGNDDFMTPLARAGYVTFDKPSKFGKYEINVLFPKDATGAALEQLRAIQAGCSEIGAAYIKHHWEAKQKKLGSKLKQSFEEFEADTKAAWKIKPFRDGDEAGKDGYDNTWFIVAKTADLSKVTVIDGELTEFHPGVKLRAQVRIFCGEGGFAYKLQGLKFIGDDGTRYKLGGGGVDGASLLRSADDAAEAASMNRQTMEESSVGAAFEVAAKTKTKAGTQSSFDVL